jgi:DNA repair exonuclease SbcCD nuclease subunit
MRLVHLADLHLGFRQFQRVTPTGVNQREADVAIAFTRAIDKTIALAPDLVLVAGDVFHTVRPTNTAILHCVRQVQRLVQALPNAPVVMIAGNHDAPRSSDTVCILTLLAQFGVTVVHRGIERIRFPELGLSVLCVPDVPRAEKTALEPDPDAKLNVLLLHGEVKGVMPGHGDNVDRATETYEATDFSAAWDYVALGHYHVYTQVAPKAYYAGAIEYTSPNAWGELGDEKKQRQPLGSKGVWEEVREERGRKLPGKGIIEHDLATGKHRFHPIEPPRRVLDLPRISARGMNAESVDVAIREAVERIPGGIEEKVVRLVVQDLPRHVARELDYKAIRDFSRRALHFQLDARRPELLRTGDANSGAPGRRPSLAETLRDRLLARSLEAGTDRERLVQLGLEYLRQADEIATPTAVDGEEEG